MEIRGIDVSAWQGKIDWKTVADYGMGFAILRITEAGNVIDSYFEQNFSECRKYNIPVGAYKYSYASCRDTERSQEGRGSSERAKTAVSGLAGSGME